jgi:hypothetical protein
MRGRRRQHWAGGGSFGYCLQDSGQLEIQHSSGVRTWGSGKVACTPSSARTQLLSLGTRAVSCIVDLQQLLSPDCSLKVGAGVGLISAAGAGGSCICAAPARLRCQARPFEVQLASRQGPPPFSA